MTAFTYVPDIGFSKQTKPRVLLTQFGDGYSHRVADGINNIDTEWDLTFNQRELAEAYGITTFFENQAGVGVFDFTPPDEVVTYRVVCQEWSMTYDAPIARSVSAKFKRVFQ